MPLDLCRLLSNLADLSSAYLIDLKKLINIKMPINHYPSDVGVHLILLDVGAKSIAYRR